MRTHQFFLGLGLVNNGGVPIGAATAAGPHSSLRLTPGHFVTSGPVARIFRGLKSQRDANGLWTKNI
ncbi:MAG: hypothetical protein ACLP7F_16400, partial [Acidimicrobiales bacterium]